MITLYNFPLTFLKTDTRTSTEHTASMTDVLIQGWRNWAVEKRPPSDFWMSCFWRGPGTHAPEAPKCALLQLGQRKQSERQEITGSINNTKQIERPTRDTSLKSQLTTIRSLLLDFNSVPLIYMLLSVSILHDVNYCGFIVFVLSFNIT